ncbi:hypothetical protein G5575_14245 [Devosia chinhatensis]|uniref:NADH:quinone oxidoreductase/Mrp antiporter transmembrane domain-containing protein n=1 Tax=Devosia aurantiaca TaxID=2714858 RepID=A0A6M1SQ14_9HYPH|nr:hypothetical protein [Devosia aurantiaca]
MLRALVAILPGSRDLLEPAIALIAIATLLTAPLGAIAETNLRRAIGFVVIGGIGAVVAGLALPTADGIAGSGLYIFHAILTMTGLYLIAGLVERTTGASDTRQMGGIYAASAPLSILFLVLILAAAGVPPFLGFWPKLLLLQASLADGVTGSEPSWIGLGLTLALLVNAVLTLIAGTRLWAHVFWRNPPVDFPVRVGTQRERLGLAAAGVLVAAVAIAGLWPSPLMEGASRGRQIFLIRRAMSTRPGLPR